VVRTSRVLEPLSSTRTCLSGRPLRRTVTTRVVRRLARSLSRAELATQLGAGDKNPCSHELDERVEGLARSR
jgi:hypothetical protein